MKRLIYIFAMILVAAGCADIREYNPYKEGIYTLTVTTLWPEGDIARSGAEVRVEDINTGSRYVSQTDIDGTSKFSLPNGLYRINLSGKTEKEVLFNASADKVVLSRQDRSVSLNVTVSKAGSIIIKEIYCGGCKKYPQEGDYQADQYVILHNNDFRVQYLDGICFGTLSPYNATGSNPWIGENGLPEFVPIIQAVWQFPGNGENFPLQPGEDAVLCLRGAIDHTAQYPLSVNLNKEDYFVCYNPTYFTNTVYHPAPGNLISQDRYLDVVIKTGQANAYTMSNASPAVVIFRAEGTTVQEFVQNSNNVIQVPGSSVDKVVKVPFDWVLDAVEVFDGRSTGNQKRLVPALDAGYATLTDVFLGHTLIRMVDEVATSAAGYEILADTNNSLNDFYESEKQSLHE